jgi:hypothetical protein
METLQRTANRGSISTGYDIDNSVKLQTAGVNSEFFNYTIGTTGDRTKGTVSMWIKRTSFGTAQYLWEQSGADNESGRLFVRFDTDDTLRIATGSTVLRVTNRVFRDTSAWYHIVVTIDTTSGTADNRTRLYVNGVEETSFSTKNNFSQNDNTGMNFGAQYIGLSVEDSASYESFDGYMAEVFGADGLVYAASDFGEFDSSGIWKPIDITGLSVGTNGFLMKFENAASMGAATSGHAFSVQNINQNDQSTDTPTNNFCTLNPNVNFKYTTNGIIDGATTFGENTGGGVGGAYGTMAITTGKWYWEAKLVLQPQHYLGVSAVDDGANVLVTSDPHEVNSTFRFNISAARIEYVNGGSQTYGSLDAFTDFHTAGDIIGIALNMDDNQISIYGNGTLQAAVANTSLFDAANKMVVPFHGTIDDTVQYNFGGFCPYIASLASAATDENGYGTFEYAPPSGYYALCTKNLAEFG